MHRTIHQKEGVVSNMQDRNNEGQNLHISKVSFVFFNFFEVNDFSQSLLT
jgi:hypothetical protein